MKTNYGNIKLVDKVNPRQLPKLRDNEYFILMITDVYHKNTRNEAEYCDYENGFIGIERTSGGKRYISKKFHHANNPARGQAFIATVDNPNFEEELNADDKCCRED